MARSTEVLETIGVPLLSRERPTRRLLAGAAAPWSPALDPVLKSAEARRFVLKSPVTTFVVVVETVALAVVLSAASRGSLVRVGTRLHCRLRPALPSCRRFWYEVA